MESVDRRDPLGHQDHKGHVESLVRKDQVERRETRENQETKVCHYIVDCHVTLDFGQVGTCCVWGLDRTVTFYAPVLDTLDKNFYIL